MKFVKIEGGVKLSHFITPMSATLSDQPAFDDPKWLFEIKWDGYRALAELNSKIKIVNVDDFKIIGWTDPKASRQYFGALLLAREVDGELVYCGEVGTGFTNELLRSLYGKIEPLELEDCRLDTPVKKEMGFHWAKPKYSCQVQYVEITDDGHVRHPSFLGLRKDK